MAADATLVLMDAAHKEKAYRGLARHYAGAGDAWMAGHATFVADIAAATAVTGALPALDAAAERLANGYLPLSGATGDVVAAVLHAREALNDALAPGVRQVWYDRLPDLVFLEGLPPASPEGLRAMVSSRIGGDTAAEFVARRQEEATARMDEVPGLLGDGHTWQAVEACYDSDLAAFEAWLVARSLEVGDEDLVQVEMRWALAVAVLEALRSLPREFRPAAEVVRSRLVWVVGPQDASDLAEHLCRLPG